MTKKILIIDDEIDLTMLMEHVFLSTGQYAVAVAHDGRQGQQAVLAENPDIIFLDYVMPEAMGDEVLEFIRSHSALKDVPVVMMSGLSGALYSDKEQCHPPIDDGTDKVCEKLLGVESCADFPQDMIQKYGVAAIFPKPFSLESLLDITARILSQETGS